MGRKKSEGESIKGTLFGYSLWAFERFRVAQNVDAGEALRMVVANWLRQENPAYLESFGVSLETYMKFTGKNVVSMAEKRAADGAKKTES